MKRVSRLLTGTLVATMLLFIGVSAFEKPALADGGWTFTSSMIYDDFVIDYSYTMDVNMGRYMNMVLDSTVVIKGYVGDDPYVDIPEEIEVPYQRPPSLSQMYEDVYRERGQIPATVECLITEIAPEAFSNNQIVKTVTFSSAFFLSKIGDRAFSGCSNLESVEARTYESAGIDIFTNCPKLKTARIICPDDPIYEKEIFKTKIITGVPSIQTVQLVGKITEIGDGVLQDCSGLKTINLPSTITKIGASAFAGCKSLLNIALPQGITGIANSTFDGCTGLQAISIPSGVTSIGTKAFRNCQSITRMIVPPKVVQIGSSAFAGCSELAELTIPTGAVVLGSGLLTDCNALTDVTITTGGQSSVFMKDLFQYNPTIQTVSLTEGVTGITGAAFYGCSKLATIDIPDSVTVIDPQAFDYTLWLSRQPVNSMAYLGNIAYRFKGSPLGGTFMVRGGTTGIAEGAFAGCTGLKSVTLPMLLDRIESFAFDGCTNLASVTVPTSVTYYGSGIFQNCSALTSVTITGNPLKTVWTSQVFQGNPTITTLTFGNGITSTGDSTFSSCARLSTINMPGTMATVGVSAFSRCTAIKSLTLPASVRTISDHALDGCTSLTKLVIPSGVTAIRAYALANCKSLPSLIIPTSVTTMGDFALQNCTALDSLTVSTSLSSLGSNILSGSSSLRNVSIARGTSSGWSSGLLAYNTAVSSVTLDDSITSIGRQAFSGCANLSSVHLPSALTTLGMASFYGCTNLKSVTMPATLVNFGPQDDFNREVGARFTIMHTFHTEGTKDWWTSNTKVMVIEAANTSTCQLRTVGVGKCSLNVTTTYYEEVYENGKKVTKERIIPSSWLFTVYGKIFGNSGLTKIIGYSGSAAEGYAKSNNFAFSPVGATQTVSIANCTVSTVANQAYTGAAIQPGITIRYNGTTLKAGTDYSLVYANNTKVGTASVTITGKGKYSGTRKVTFAIMAKPVSALSLTAIAAKPYTGAAIKPAITLKNASKALVLNTDYIVSYANNTGIGVATVTITGKGNYSGTRKTTFTIVPRQVTGLATASRTTTTIKLSWAKLSEATGYEVYVYDSATKKYVLAKTVTTNTASLTLSSLKTGAAYTYRIRAYKTVGVTKYFGSYSATLYSATLPTTPALTATTGSGQATISWKAIAGVAGYEVYMASSSTGSYGIIATLSSPTTVRYTKAGLTKGKTYCFKARAYLVVNGAKVYSSYSAVKLVKVS